MKSTNLEKATNSVGVETDQSIIETLATQMDRAEDAKRRIEKEGIVVRDLRGSVIPHPAIKIEIEAGKIIVDLIKKNKLHRRGIKRGR